MAKKTQAVYLIDAEDDKGVCRRDSCLSCSLRTRCKHTAVMRIELTAGDTLDSSRVFDVVVEPYRYKAANYKLFQWLQFHYSRETFNAMWLEELGYDKDSFGRFCGNCNCWKLYPASSEEKFAADHEFVDVIDARKIEHRGF